jgi:hypothetical protein
MVRFGACMILLLPPAATAAAALASSSVSVLAGVVSMEMTARAAGDGQRDWVSALTNNGIIHLTLENPIPAVNLWRMARKRKSSVKKKFIPLFCCFYLHIFTSGRFKLPFTWRNGNLAFATNS